MNSISHSTIVMTGVRQHNLKNVTVTIPKNKLTVITGLSGSGKFSLAFDTLFVEGQRRYMESLSSYARQFLDTLEKPEFDSIEGLSPTIAIDQKSASNNPRSTVGTMTEIYDLLRVLFAKCGTPHCPKHPGQVLESQTEEQTLARIVDHLNQKGLPQKISIFAPVVTDRKGEHKYAIRQAKKGGFHRLRLDGVRMSVEEAETLEINPNIRHTIEIEVLHLGVYSFDRETMKLVSQAIVQAMVLGNGVMFVIDENDQEMYYSQHYTCAQCGFNLSTIDPRLFSFNSPHGACLVCHGLGTRLEFAVDLIIPNRRLTLLEGAVRPWSRITSHSHWYQKSLDLCAREYGINPNVPVNELNPKQIDLLLYGDDRSKTSDDYFEGVIPNLRRRFEETDSDYLRQEIEKYMVRKICDACHGQRLRAEILGITVADKNIVAINAMSVDECYSFFGGAFKVTNQTVYERLIVEIRRRLKFLQDVGLSYLTLDRTAQTLAGGEAQRIRLATQLGSQLEGVIYVLDEPSIGLHPRDHHRLLTTLLNLRDNGNTVVVVEHDAATMRAADYLIDIGPGAGERGGEVVAAGTPNEVMSNPQSITGRYLSGIETIGLPIKRRNDAKKWLTIVGANEFNLQNVTARFPLEHLVCVTGVSGSGKSTLVTDILARALAMKFHRAKVQPGAYDSISGLEYIDKVIDIDQSPIGRTPRSNPVTYAGIFGTIRDLFAHTSLAHEKLFDAGHFSFNLRGGRCETCKGDGQIQVEMNFLPNMYVPCADCQGKRYNPEALEITYHSKTIADVLAMTVDEAVKFFGDHELIRHKLTVLSDVGLGYMRLGQSATTLSGGESQRVKLATELARQSTGKTLYILDEPTTGLHFEDVKRLLHVLQALVDKGNSVIVVEHDLDVIKSADWVIDLGPEGGDKGGQIVAEGTPEMVSQVTASHTGRYLKNIILKG